MDFSDHGPNPYIINIEDATVQNTLYRQTIWTGSKLQLTVMSIDPGHDIGLEQHMDHDQFLRVEAGKGLVQMGPTETDLNFEKEAHDDDAIFIPAGMWHNVTNTGDEPLKVYSIYAPPEHPHGTVHATYEEAMAAEAEHHHH